MNGIRFEGVFANAHNVWLVAFMPVWSYMKPLNRWNRDPKASPGDASVVALIGHLVVAKAMVNDA
jgi:hypothetical protein